MASAVCARGHTQAHRGQIARRNFENHPNLEKLYLPDGYEGNPMLKSFELISREVKPWPGEVDVEGMPEESESDKSEDG